MSRDFDLTAGEYLEIADGGPSDLLGPFTIHAWINPDVVTGTKRIFAKWASSTTLRQWLFQINASKLDGRSGGSTSNDTVTGATNVSTGVWSAVAYRRNGSGTGIAHQLVLNGTQDATANTGQTVSNRTTAIRVATENDDTNHFDGRICEVAIWAAFLSDAELLALARGVSPMQIRPTLLRGYWPIFGNASPEPDYRGGGNATIAGTPVRATNHAPMARF